MGWSEITAYSGNRKGVVLGRVASQSVDNSAAVATFSINGTATVGGVFVTTVETSTSGDLYGAADFSSSRGVESGDSLEVTASLTAASA